MIDIENIVTDTLIDFMSVAYPSADVTNEYTEAPASFPHICVEQEVNAVYQKTLDNVLHEHHAELVFIINVYSASLTGKKAECKKIASLVDDCMSGMKLTRTMCEPVPNADTRVYRMTMRYRGIVEQGHIVGDKTVYQMYRS